MTKNRLHRLITLTIVSVGTLIAVAPSFAHGPTIELSHDEMKPVLLNLFVGTTVHFVNTVKMPGGYVVVDEAGNIESPALVEPGEGWHYTFENVGTFELYIRQHPEAKARIVVVPRRGATRNPDTHKGHDAGDGTHPAH